MDGNPTFLEVKAGCARVRLWLPRRSGFPANCSRRVARSHSEVSGSALLTIGAHTFGLSTRTTFRCEYPQSRTVNRSLSKMNLSELFRLIEIQFFWTLRGRIKEWLLLR